MNKPFIIDAHLDLSMNALEWNRDLRQPLKEINRREIGMTDKPDRGNATISFEELRKGNVGLVVATQIGRYVGPDNPLPGWHSPEQAWAGFYATECGNILGLGGAFFASLIAVSSLAKEEKEHTAEFLFAHPISRKKILTEKLTSVLFQLLILNVIVFLLSVGSISLIGEKILWKEICLLHLAYFLIQIELAGICFGISAFLRRSGLGIGLGIATMMYFLNIIANISDQAKFLKYITPFGYANGADIVENGSLDTGMVLTGMLFAVIGILTAYWKYSRKDIQA